MEDKKLSIDDIELLERQGLVADIRNQLNGPANLLGLLELSLENTEEGRFAKKHLEEHLSELVASSKDSIAHMLGAMTYCQRLPEELRVDILNGKPLR